MRKSNPKTIETLEQKIRAGRKKLQELYNASGYNDYAVLAYSIKLDKLIVRYQKMTMVSEISKIHRIKS
jgi:hypothetical protein